MRSAIFMGLIYIGDKVGNVSSPEYVATVVPVLAVSLLIFAVMDIVDFFRGKAG